MIHVCRRLMRQRPRAAAGSRVEHLVVYLLEAGAHGAVLSSAIAGEHHVGG